MKLKFVIPLLLLFSLDISAQVKVGGINIPLTVSAHETTLVLNGAGVREKFYKDLFVLALYLKEKSNEALKIMHANEPMAIKMHILSGLITSDRMEETTDEGFVRSTEGHTEPIQAKINEFKAVFKQKIKKGDVYDFVYHPDKGTHVYKNGILAVIIPGLDFKQALFGIWLFKKPKDSDIQDKLMGK